MNDASPPPDDAPGSPSPDPKQDPRRDPEVFADGPRQGPAGGSGVGSGVGSGGASIPKHHRNSAMLAHLLGAVGYVIPPSGIFFGPIIGPLLIWLLKREEHPFVEEQAKEALNFQITVSLTLVVLVVTFWALIPLLLIPVVWVGGLGLTILGAVRASDGEAYRYPLCLRLVK